MKTLEPGQHHMHIVIISHHGMEVNLASFHMMDMWK